VRAPRSAPRHRASSFGLRPRPTPPPPPLPRLNRKQS
jgi:hypothetical protein